MVQSHTSFFFKCKYIYFPQITLVGLQPEHSGSHLHYILF